MKYLGLVLNRTTLIGVVSLCAAVHLFRADPTDDFSLSLNHISEASVSGNYSLMSEPQVAGILADRLDLFPRSQTPRLAAHLVSLCRLHGFDPAFILSLIQVESEFHIKAESPVGALGLMQLMPQTARRFAADAGIGVELTDRVLLDPYVNLSVGITYLARLRDRYHGLSPYVLAAAYNVGPARMDVLLSRKSFRPAMTGRYYEAIRRGMPDLRFYRGKA
jgi:hypothetical protein